MTENTSKRSYAILAASLIMLIAGYGIYYCYSIFFNSLAAEFHSDKATVSGAFSLAVVVSGMLSAVAGRISDRLGPKVVCFFSGVCLGAGLLLMSQVQSIWQVYLIYGIPLSIGVGGIFPAAVSTVARWFGQKRGMMIGIVTTGIGFGSLIYSPLIGRLIFNYGWRQTYVIVGITVLVIVLPLSLILKRPETPNINDHKQNKPTSSPPAGNEDFTYREAVRTRQFWMLVIIYFFSGLGQFGLMVHIVPYATGQGISPVSAASIVSVIGGASIFGRLIIGGIGDKVKVKPLLTGISVVLAISLIWLELAREMPEFIAIGIIFGLGYGGFSTLQSLVAVEMFGLSTLGVILGNFIFSVCIGGSLGPVITGFVFDRTSSYPTAFLPGTITSVISLIMVFWLSHPKRRIT